MGVILQSSKLEIRAICGAFITTQEATEAEIARREEYLRKKLRERAQSEKFKDFEEKEIYFTYSPLPIKYVEIIGHMILKRKEESP